MKNQKIISNKTRNCERLLRLFEVLDFISREKLTCLDGVKTGCYPQPVKLGERTTCCRNSEIQHLVEQGVH